MAWNSPVPQAMNTPPGPASTPLPTWRANRSRSTSPASVIGVTGKNRTPLNVGCIGRDSLIGVAGSVTGQSAIDAPPQVVWIVVGNCTGQQRLLNVLVGDRAKEALDRTRANRCAPRVGRGRVWATVHHRVPDLDAGRPAVEEDPACLELEQGHQLASIVVVGLVGVHGGSQLALEALGDGAHLGCVGAAHDQARRAEYLGLQPLRAQET